MSNIKLLEGATIAAESFVGELIFFIIAGILNIFSQNTNFCFEGCRCNPQYWLLSSFTIQALFKKKKNFESLLDILMGRNSFSLFSILGFTYRPVAATMGEYCQPIFSGCPLLRSLLHIIVGGSVVLVDGFCFVHFTEGRGFKSRCWHFHFHDTTLWLVWKMYLCSL